jgi:GntR family transcriptional regulator / MocR family aminotransferase
MPWDPGRIAARHGSLPRLDAVGPYRITNPGPGGLILGYATVSERAITEGVARLANALREL